MADKKNEKATRVFLKNMEDFTLADFTLNSIEKIAEARKDTIISSEILKNTKYRNCQWKNID